MQFDACIITRPRAVFFFSLHEQKGLPKTLRGGMCLFFYLPIALQAGDIHVGRSQSSSIPISVHISRKKTPITALLPDLMYMSSRMMTLLAVVEGARGKYVQESKP